MTDEWQADAACRQTDPEMFTPSQSDWRTIDSAKAICATCPVIEQCRRYADETADTWSILGGTTPLDRHVHWGKVAYQIQHGTPGGNKAHRARGETPCTACKAAEARRQHYRPRGMEAAS